MSGRFVDAPEVHYVVNNRWDAYDEAEHVEVRAWVSDHVVGLAFGFYGERESRAGRIVSELGVYDAVELFAYIELDSRSERV